MISEMTREERIHLFTVMSKEERHRFLNDPNRPWLVNPNSPGKRHTERSILRGIVYNRDNFTCQQCGKKFVPQDVLDDPEFSYDGLHNIRGLSMGHIIPRSRGGRFNEENIKAQCDKCNNALGDQLWTVFYLDIAVAA